MSAETGKDQATKKHTDAWPIDALDGARMIMEAVSAILRSDAVVAYVRPGVAGVGLELARVLDDAEIVAAGAMNRSRARCQNGPLNDFFRQTQLPASLVSPTREGGASADR